MRGAAQIQRIPERRHNLLGEPENHFRGDIAQEHDELVAAEAEHAAGPTDVFGCHPLEPLGDALQHQVAPGMSECVVELLESVEVEE